MVFTISLGFQPQTTVSSLVLCHIHHIWLQMTFGCFLDVNVLKNRFTLINGGLFCFVWVHSKNLLVFGHTSTHGTLVSQPDLEAVPAALQAQSPKRQTTREVPRFCAFIFQLKIFFFNGVKTPPFNLQGGVLVPSEH